MNEELVERVAMDVCKARGINPDSDPRSWDVRLDIVACLASIEAAGMVIVPRESFDAAREFIKGIAEDRHTQGVPWRAAERLLERLAASPKK